MAFDYLIANYAKLAPMIKKAREYGYPEPVIASHLATWEKTAASAGYSPEEINQYLGRTPDSIKNAQAAMTQTQVDNYKSALGGTLNEPTIKNRLTTAEIANISPAMAMNDKLNDFFDSDPEVQQYKLQRQAEQKANIEDAKNKDIETFNHANMLQRLGDAMLDSRVTHWLVSQPWAEPLTDRFIDPILVPIIKDAIIPTSSAITDVWAGMPLKAAERFSRTLGMTSVGDALAGISRGVRQFSEGMMESAKLPDVGPEDRTTVQVNDNVKQMLNLPSNTLTFSRKKYATGPTSQGVFKGVGNVAAYMALPFGPLTSAGLMGAADNQESRDYIYDSLVSKGMNKDEAYAHANAIMPNTVDYLNRFTLSYIAMHLMGANVNPRSLISPYVQRLFHAGEAALAGAGLTASTELATQYRAGQPIDPMQTILHSGQTALFNAVFTGLHSIMGYRNLRSNNDIWKSIRSYDGYLKEAGLNQSILKGATAESLANEIKSRVLTGNMAPAKAIGLFKKLNYSEEMINEFNSVIKKNYQRIIDSVKEMPIEGAPKEPEPVPEVLSIEEHPQAEQIPPTVSVMDETPRIEPEPQTPIPPSSDMEPETQREPEPQNIPVNVPPDANRLSDEDASNKLLEVLNSLGGEGEILNVAQKSGLDAEQVDKSVTDLRSEGVIDTRNGEIPEQSPVLNIVPEAERIEPIKSAKQGIDKEPAIAPSLGKPLQYQTQVQSFIIKLLKDKLIPKNKIFTEARNGIVSRWNAYNTPRENIIKIMDMVSKYKDSKLKNAMNTILAHLNTEIGVEKPETKVPETVPAKPIETVTIPPITPGVAETPSKVVVKNVGEAKLQSGDIGLEINKQVEAGKLTDNEYTRSAAQWIMDKWDSAKGMYDNVDALLEDLEVNPQRETKEEGMLHNAKSDILNQLRRVATGTEHGESITSEVPQELTPVTAEGEYAIKPPVSEESFRDMFDEAAKFRGGLYARISDMRKLLGWTKDQFDGMVKNLRDKGHLQLQTGDTNYYTDDDMKNSFIDENGVQSLTLKFRPRRYNEARDYIRGSVVGEEPKMTAKLMNELIAKGHDYTDASNAIHDAAAEGDIELSYNPDKVTDNAYVDQYTNNVYNEVSKPEPEINYRNLTKDIAPEDVVTSLGDMIWDPVQQKVIVC